MSTKTKKVLIFVVTFLLVLAMGATTVFGAIDPSQLTGTAPSANDETTIKDLGNRIIGALKAVSIVLAVVILTILGIKYMMGSAEEKADYKKTMIPYVVGAAVIFLAPQIAGALIGFFSSTTA